MVRILFLHPDLGIGGAERLVVDAAVALKQHGHTVSFLTNHHDREHCFAETRDGTFDVQTVGEWIPRSLFGRFVALFAYIRMMYAAICLLIFGPKVDIVFSDQISVPIPILKLIPKRPRILFYCHFPDQLLSIRESRLKACYRCPLDWLEEWTTGQADRLLVNSGFTQKVFKKTFKRLTVTPDIIYPSLNCRIFDETTEISSSIDELFHDKPYTFLSLNRYERKKNLSLAINSFKELEKYLTPDKWLQSHLIIAGGWDHRVTENREHHQELLHLANSLQLSDKVTFLKSPKDPEKLQLLRKCFCLLYTPSNEHFGIVPIEAMYLKRPVIAVNSGGPLETICPGETGYLCDPNPDEFAKIMGRLCKMDEEQLEKIGEKGRRRVVDHFSFESFGRKLNRIVENLMAEKSKRD